LSFALAFGLTPLVIRFATAKGILKHPKRKRDLHNKPIPLLGGLSIIVSFTITVLINSLLNSNFHVTKEVAGLAVGVVIIAIMGLLDDLFDIKPYIKALFQIIAAILTVAISGSKIEYFTGLVNSNKLVNLPNIISFIATVAWIFLLTNAFNIIDGIDGLTTGTTIICSLTLFFIGFVRPDAMHIGEYIPVLLLALAGAAAGFLPFNFNPAKIYLGETGAAFLGFVTAVISIQGTMKAHTAIAVFIPLTAMGLPILDISLAYFRRLIMKKPVTEGDKEHIHHRMMQMGLSQRKTVLILYGINILLGFVAYWLSETQYTRLWLISAIVLILAGGAIYVLYMPLLKQYMKNGNNNRIKKESQDDQEEV